MKQQFILSASIAAALAITPGALLAMRSSQVSGGTSTSEAPRITQTVSNNQLLSLPKSHLSAVVALATSATPAADSTPMNHLQLILQPSAQREASMRALIASQHDPKSAKFHQWLTPTEFGNEFGVVDSDIASLTSWLTSQGFTVNNVYPNKTEIDFSGTAGQVKQAFHTQETVYTLPDGKHLANASDISVPAAFGNVISGVMGLDDFQLQPAHGKSEVAQWNATKKSFTSVKDGAAGTKPIGMAINQNSASRALVPNDMVTMYGIRTIRNNGVTGKGINIAVVEDAGMDESDWDNFVSVFNLAQYGGTFTQFQPQPPSGTTNCVAPFMRGTIEYGDQPATDSEWATAIAPGANIWVASCNDYLGDGVATTNQIGGAFIAATNLINATDASSRPDIITATFNRSETFIDAASKTGIDQMWAQADAEGISVFVPTGESGTNTDESGAPISGVYGDTTFASNALASSPNDTAVGGTDLADVLDGTTSHYFAPTPSVVGGSALSYVPEIAWNDSCGNGVAAKHYGYTVMAFCQKFLQLDYNSYYLTSTAASGAPSADEAKPAWQGLVHNAAQDQSRDLPDVALFAGSYGDATWMITCTNDYPCTPGFSPSIPANLVQGTEISSVMFAGIQALIDQGIAMRGLPADQGNAAPTLYALAAQEYGSATGPTPTSLAACNADNGTTGTANCVFHNVTRGNNSTNCYQGTFGSTQIITNHCYFYGTGVEYIYPIQVGLTSMDAAPTSYTATNKAFPAQPGWSFATGLGSVNATNLLIAWRAFVGAPPAQASTH